MITFPFKREERYSISALHEFVLALAEARQQYPDLITSERARTLPWAKLWWEELYPLKLFLDQNPQGLFSQFRILPEGNAIDVELWSADRITRFQITTAYPEWKKASETRTGGYVRSLEREALNQGVPVFPGRQIRRIDGKVISEPDVRSSDVDEEAWKRGLSSAIEDKLSKSERYAGNVDILLIYAERLRFDLIDTDMSSLVRSVMAECCSKQKAVPFAKIVVLDKDPLAYVQYP
jgi:hypothetical protein